MLRTQLEQATPEVQGVAKHDQDRYPELATVLRFIEEDLDLPTGPVEKIEITALASGEATYRVWPARAEEPIGGYLSPEVLWSVQR